MKFRIGAGTLITVVIALIVGGYSVLQQRRIASQPPVVERTIEGASPQGVAPVPEFLLRHTSTLHLTHTQTQAIAGIAAQYRREMAPITQKLQAASTEFRQYMDRDTLTTRHTKQDVSQHSAELQRWSHVVVAMRHAYWQQARAVLTSAQRRQADTLASKATLQDMQ